jgi:hypothetical protein
MQLPVLNLDDRRQNKIKIAKIKLTSQIIEHLTGGGGENVGRRGSKDEV